MFLEMFYPLSASILVNIDFGVIVIYFLFLERLNMFLDACLFFLISKRFSLDLFYMDSGWEIKLRYIR